MEKRLEVQGSMARGSSTWRKLLTQLSIQRDGDGDATVDGSTRSESEDG